MADDPAVGVLTFVFNLVSDLISGYEKGKTDLFSNHVEPLQAKMLDIHTDYVTGFQEVVRHLKDESKPPVELIDFLQNRRLDYAAQRDLAEQLAKSLAFAERRIVRNDAWRAVKAYCESVSSYFYPPSDFAFPTWYASYIDLVRSKIALARTTDPDKSVWRDFSITTLGDAVKGDHARSQLLKAAQTVLNRDLPDALQKVNAHYADLRTKLLA